MFQCSNCTTPSLQKAILKEVAVKPIGFATQDAPHNGPRKQTAFTFPNGCSESRDLNVSFNNLLYGLIKKKCVFLATQVFLAIVPS